MKKKLTIILSALAAITLVVVGAETFACDEHNKSASNQATATYAIDQAKTGSDGCTYVSGRCGSAKSAQYASSNGASCNTKSVQTAGAGCCPSSKSAQMAGAGKSGCGSSAKNADWASSLCGEKGYYAANVYEIRDGQPLAVFQGKTFKVTEATPFVQVEAARYYVTDEASKARCSAIMKSLTSEVDRETVALATREGNVETNAEGLKVAHCPLTGQNFVVTADSPVKVMDGQKYYISREVDLSTLSSSNHD